VIAFRDASVVLGGRTVAGPLRFSVAPGEFVVLLGRSGSGKTTTLRLINALIKPTAGVVEVAGRDTSAWDPVSLRRSIGYVIQEIGLFPHFPVSRNVGIVPELAGWTADRIARRVSDLLELVGLSEAEFAHRYPHERSGGQRQRVGVARALAADPPVLLCDEPFGALDPLTRAELQVEFEALARQLGKTVVFVTHDVGEALRLGDRIVLFDNGSVRFDGDRMAFRTSVDAYVRAFRDSG